MGEGIDAEHVIRIGYLNDKVDERMDLYLEMFDVVLVATESGPAGMDYTIRLLEYIQASSSS